MANDARFRVLRGSTLVGDGARDASSSSSSPLGPCSCDPLFP